MSITDPAEGQVVEGGSFVAQGVASSFEATVEWELRDETDAVVVSGFATADGWMDRLYPWRTEVDVSDLAPGRYTFVASTVDASGRRRRSRRHVRHAHRRRPVGPPPPSPRSPRWRS